MSLVISKVFTYDTDAGNYIQAVEAADTAALEPATRQAINNFVIGCKQDGIWSAIKASCILSGARTLSGALVPLSGTAPTNNYFVSGDYNRKTGLIGDGTSKYLNSNRAYNATPSNNEHLALYKSTEGSGNQNFIGGGLTSPASLSRLGHFSSLARFNLQNGTGDYGSTNAIGFMGGNRSSSSAFNYRQLGATVTASVTSETRSNTATNYGIFCANYGDIGVTGLSNARLAFYSIGESIDLALLDARVTALITAFGVAIP